MATVRSRPGPLHSSSLLHSVRAYTVLELMVNLAIFAIVLKTAVSYCDPKRMQIVAAQRQLIANLRVARTNAITRSVHYQVSLPTATQIKIAQMQETPAGSGTWQVNSTNVQTINLPSVVQIKSTEVGTTIEFTSRGWVVNLAAPLQIDAQDSFGQTKSLQVYPSGQVNGL